MTQPMQHTQQQPGLVPNPVEQHGMGHQQPPAQHQQHQMPRHQQGNAGGQSTSSEHFTVTHTYQNGDAAGHMIRVVSPIGVYAESVGSTEQDASSQHQQHAPVEHNGGSHPRNTQHQSSGTSGEGL